MRSLIKKLLPKRLKNVLKSFFGMATAINTLTHRLDALERALADRIGTAAERTLSDRLNTLEESVALLNAIEGLLPVKTEQTESLETPNNLHPNELAKLVRKRKLRAAKTLEDIRRIADEMGYTYFLDYDEQIETKKREFISAINYFDVSLQGARVLDVGPGTADGLDVARENGAAVTLFIEEEPFFVKWAEAKDHLGAEANYTFKPFFPASWARSIDIIYTKGSINCDWVNEQQAYLASGDPRGFFDFQEWVQCLIDLLDPARGSIVLMPAMGRQSETLVDEVYDLETEYWCPDVDAYRNSFFANTLRAAGFREVENIEGFTHPKAFPLAFFYSSTNHS